MPLGEQKDAYEFGAMLFDKLERGGAQPLLQRHFKGELVYHTASAEPGDDEGRRLSERVEPFYMLTAEVRRGSNRAGFDASWLRTHHRNACVFPVWACPL